MNITNKDVQITYKKLFRYVDTIVYKYYNQKDNRNAFKNISHDYKDLVHETYIVVLKHLEQYKDKYINVKTFEGARGIHLDHHIKNMVLYKLKNILRDNLNQGFVALEEIFPDVEVVEKIRSNKVDQEIDHLEEKNDLNKFRNPEKAKNEDELELEREKIRARFVKLFNPLMIPAKPKEQLLNTEEIENILKRDCKTKDEYKVMELRIIYNYSFKEIFKMLNLSSRQNAYDKFQRVIKRLKKRFKTKDKLIE